MIYNRDIAHCMGRRCKLRNECYRYWLRKNMPRRASFVIYMHPEFNPTTGECKWFYKFPEP